MDDLLTLCIRNDAAEVHPAGDTVSGWLQVHGQSALAAYWARLAIEELALNVIAYAFADDREHRIGIEVRLEGDTVGITLLDDGRPFNPLAAAPPDLALPPEDRLVGGLGIHLLVQWSDRLAYERRDGWNRVSLWRTFTAEAETADGK